MEAQFGGSFVDAGGKAISNAEWIYNPDLSAVEGYPSIYWIAYPAPNDSVDLMDASARAAVDAQLLSDRYDDIVSQLEQAEDILRQVVIMTVGEINLLREWIVNFKAAVAAAGNLGQLQTAVEALPDMPDRTFAQVKQQLRDSLGT